MLVPLILDDLPSIGQNGGLGAVRGIICSENSMTYQFQCPQGHLLEGEPSQAGQQCNCPTCGMLFIIPPSPEITTMPAAAHNPFAPAAADPLQATLPNIGPGAAPAEAIPNLGGPTADVTGDPLARSDEPEFLHIPCPNGHELETPFDMLEQDVLCPHCGAQFRLRMKDSVEHKRKRKDEVQRRENKAGKVWLNWAVVIGVLVLISIIGMIAMSFAS
jgi:hypothetical protein